MARPPPKLPIGYDPRRRRSRTYSLTLGDLAVRAWEWLAIGFAAGWLLCEHIQP